MKSSCVLAAGLVAATGLAQAALPAITSVRQAKPPEIAQQMRAGLLPDGPGGTMSIPGPRYEKLELRIELRATYQNPYDPDQLDLWAEFTAPSGKVWKIWGFYNPSSWSALWMVRFTPVETGTWHYVVKVKDHEGIAESAVAYHSTTWLPTGSSSHGAISFNRVRRREERLAKAASL
jgi:Domain of unknown function (DUF5060)